MERIAKLSIPNKIHADKVSAGSLLTAITVFLLYKQIQEQVEDRKATSRPDLYFDNQDYPIIRTLGRAQDWILYPVVELLGAIDCTWIVLCNFG